MSLKPVALFVAFGCDYEVHKGVVVGIGRNGKIRAAAAFERAERYRMVYPKSEVYLVSAPGREAKRTSGPTMAALTERYWQGRNGDVSTIVNYDDVTVWSTYAEMEWVYKYCATHFAERQVYVTFLAAPRQNTRTKIMQSWFFPNWSIRVASTNEAKVPLYHETFAYLKLVLFKLGLRRPLEWLRRKTAIPHTHA
jgi:hypothetical protein